MPKAYKEKPYCVNDDPQCLNSSNICLVVPLSASPGSASAVGEAGGAQTRITCDPTLSKKLIRIHRSLDFLKISYWIQWDDSTFLETLDWLKKRMQDTDDQEQCIFNDCCLDWNLQRTGTLKFNYRLRSGDVTLLFNRREPTGTIPNFRIEVGSLTSQTSLYQTIIDVKHWMERKQANFLKEQVSEIHLAADFIGLDIRSLGVENQENWIHRSHTFIPYYEHRKLTGVSIGKGDLMLRIYDKVTELKSSAHKQEVFADLWQVSVYDDHPVTRVEYQLRRPVLREFQHLEFCNSVKSVKHTLFAVKALWNYCTSDWARFMDSKVDRGNRHQDRATYSKFWEIVRSVTWTGLEELRREKPIKHKNIEALQKQARGILMSVAAFSISNPEDLERIIEKSQTVIEEELREYFKDYSKFVRKMREKRNEVLLDTVPF